MGNVFVICEVNVAGQLTCHGKNLIDHQLLIRICYMERVFSSFFFYKRSILSTLEAVIQCQALNPKVGGNGRKHLMKVVCHEILLYSSVSH